MKRKSPNLYLSEMRACLLLCLLLCVAVVSQFLYQRWIQSRDVPVHVVTFICEEAESLKTGKDVFKPGNTSHSVEDRSVRRPSRSYARRNARQGHTNVSGSRTARRVTCAPFDPNTIAGDTLKKWGVRGYVAENLVKYRDSGGSFRSVADLGKIYGMDSTTMRILSACVKIRAPEHSREASILDINSATVEDLMKLRGIGPVFAARIVKFRDALGGFSNVEQVAETYGLPPETFAQVKAFLSLSTGPRKIHVNSASAEELAAHPYISHRAARSIANYIANHGHLASTDDLLDIHNLDHDWIRRITPYLDFEVTIPVSTMQE